MRDPEVREELAAEAFTPNDFEMSWFLWQWHAITLFDARALTGYNSRIQWT